MYSTRFSRSAGVVIVLSLVGAVLVTAASYMVPLSRPEWLQGVFVKVGEVLSGVGGLPGTGGSRSTTGNAEAVGMLIVSWGVFFAIGMGVRALVARKG